MKKPVVLFALAISFFSFAYKGSPAQEIPNLTKVKKEVRNYYESGRWEKEVNEKFTQAAKILDEFEGDRTKAAIVMDIDETVLTSYPFLEKIDFAFNAFLPQWSDWVIKAKAPAIKSALRFYDKAVDMGFPVFFVTGRAEEYRGLSEKNLQSEGFKDYAGLIHRHPGLVNKPAAEAKSKARQNIERQGYEILLNIGDQRSDLDGGYAKHTILLPNPMYFVP